jgi:unsaturated rhamnogalacturonyl hydrolase
MIRILLSGLIVCIATVFLSCKGTHKDEISHTGNKSPEVIGKMIITDLLNRAEIWIAETDEYTSVHYAEACTGFGATRFAGILKDSITIRRLSDRYLKILREGPVNSGNHVDANVYGILPLEIYMQDNNEEFLRQGLRLADMQWENPLPDGLTNQTRYWIDDVWMIGSLQVQAYRATGNRKYLERVALEIDSYVQKLQQANGLFRHGKESPFFWGRGNGWVAAGLAELLSELPESDQHYKSIAGGYKKMMDALVRYQAKSGMWRQLIDKEEAWEETSSTAMFGYALAVGVKIKILSENRYAPVYQKAWMALTKHINDEGKMTDVCVGTGQSDNKEYYLSRPKITGDMHGQAPMLWFASVLLDKK